jgi:hypothetical protein
MLAIFIFKSLVGIFNAAIRFFRACKLGCPGSCRLDVLLAMVFVVVEEEEDCANANLVVNNGEDDIDGIAVRLSVSPNNTIKQNDILLRILVINLNYYTSS